ncbi:hypothetical protein [Burkholderia sp. Bp9142]|uniref:hypothetical protein n=1 Tax=Burkholderia sp. Bp9142 TaxID=2184573 RepID=UPI000F5AE969|nr:hypothetical protein [Burkholderia sp. Bp9142]
MNSAMQSITNCSVDLSAHFLALLGNAQSRSSQCRAEAAIWLMQLTVKPDGVDELVSTHTSSACISLRR